MKAVIENAHGGAEVLEVSDVEVPAPGRGEVLVRVEAAGINRADAMQRRGLYPPPAGASNIYGLEVSGVIEETGFGVSQDLVGLEVIALLAGGGYAEYVAVDARHCLPKPQNLSFEEAAGIIEVAATVYSNLVLTCGVSIDPEENRGKSVLIHGGAGGIGLHAIEFSQAIGLQVFATAGSAQKCDLIESLGATAINYKEADFAAVLHEKTAERGVDYILDVVGGAYLDANLKSLVDGGHLTIIGLQKGAKAEVNLGLMLSRRLSLHATSLRSRAAEDKAEIVAGVAQHVLPLIADGTIDTNVTKTFQLEEVAQAHAYFDSGEHSGKIVLTVCH